MPQRRRAKWFPDTSWSNLPDSITQTKEWILATDELTKQRFDPSFPREPDRHRGQSEIYFTKRVNEDVFQELVDSRRIMCQSHLAVSRQATFLLADEDFEEKWLALSPETRERYFIEAFKTQGVRSIDIPMLDIPDKMNCPEICLDELSKDGGRGYLGLLKQFLLDNNIELLGQPFVFINQRFDEIIGWQDNDISPNRKASLC